MKRCNTDRELRVTAVLGALPAIIIMPRRNRTTKRCNTDREVRVTAVLGAGEGRGIIIIIGIIINVILRVLNPSRSLAPYKVTLPRPFHSTALLDTVFVWPFGRR